MCSCELLCIFVVHLLTQSTSQLLYYEKKILKKFSLDIEKSQISHLVLKSVVCLFLTLKRLKPCILEFMPAAFSFHLCHVYV